jgi:P4 family phage/plasmid primase-like protien
MYKLFPPEELRKYMWEHLASTLIGTSMNQTFNIYVGGGSNGKSVLMDLMKMALGEYKENVPLSIITEKRTKIGGLAPEIVKLKGARYAVMQEPQKGEKINEGIMKELTSGLDPIQARAPYMQNAITFIPQFKLVLCSNNFPEIKSQDHGTWRRIRVVPFLSLFTKNPVEGDPDKPYQFMIVEDINEKFNEWKEVWMSMLVEKAFETNGLVNDCDIVIQSSNSYRESQDYIAEFIAYKVLVDPAGTITKTELTSEYTLWYQGTYGRGGPNIKDVQAYMDKKFGKFDKHKCWKGVKINYEKETGISEEDMEEDFGEVDGDQL